VEPLTISASQLGTWDDCHRKWWLQRVARLPEVPRGYLIFGTVLHACLERWCSGDANGRVPLGPCRPKDEENRWLVRDGGPLDGQGVGEPVQVFPAGWETVEEKGQKQTVTPNEAALIRKLVEQAVERGIVQRGDGRVLEREIRLPVIDGVELVGFLDVFKPAEAEQNHAIPQIHDHKTFGEGSVRFLKQASAASPNYVGADRQLLTYAAATSLIDGWSGPVVVRHNQFPKFDDGRGPRSVEAVVPPEAWAERWSEIQAAAVEMLRVREIKRWDDVAGPVQPDTCQKYGGCPFREICGRRTTLDGYRASVERRIKDAPGARPNVSTGPLRGEKNMTDQGNIFARARGARSASTEQTRPVSSTTAAAPASAAPASDQPGINGGVAPAAPAAPIAPPANAPPWANPACTACRGTGFNSKGRPCPICDALAKRSRRPTSSMYLIEGDAQAGFVCHAKEGKAQEIVDLGAPTSWSSRGGSFRPQAEPAKGPTATPVVAVAVQQAPVTQTGGGTSTAVEKTCEPTEQPCVEVDAPAATAKRGRKPAGITIMVGCAQLKGPDRSTITAQDLLQRLGAELAKDTGAASYWELDAFKRRDRIRQRSAEIAESLGTTVILVAGLRDPDVDSLIGALIPHAQVVVEGLR
jgi:PD-(D/E)XK nuclease superfamily protein